MIKGMFLTIAVITIFCGMIAVTVMFAVAIATVISNVAKKVLKQISKNT